MSNSFRNLKIFVNCQNCKSMTNSNNWCRYQRKRIKVGIMPEEQRILFKQLTSIRLGEYAGGRKKKVELHGNS